MNESWSSNSQAGSFLKFDCVDNSSTTYSSFDDLWTRGDADVAGSASGNQTNALILAGGIGKYLP